MSDERGRFASRTLAELSGATSPSDLLGDGATVISDIACAIDDVRPRALFAPLDLAPPRAARLAAQAVARGAAALLTEQQFELPVPQLIVPDVRIALPTISAAFYGFPATHLRSIGVTGTKGKTTTTFLIDAILRNAGEHPGLIGTLEWRAGQDRIRHQLQRTTPESPTVQRLLRAMVEAGDQWAVIEASSQGLAQRRLDTVPFTIGAVTSITQDHLDFHGSIAAYRRAKAMLFERVAECGGTAVINADDPAARAMRPYAGSARIVTYSAEGRLADVRATDLAPGLEGTRFTLSLTGQQAPVHLPLLGSFNVSNALCAAAVAHAIGIDLDLITSSLATVSPVPGRLEPIRAGQPFLVLVDEAQTPAQLAASLDVAQQVTPGGRVILVTGASDLISPDQLRQKGEVAMLAADFTAFTIQHARRTDPVTLVAHLVTGARAAGAVAGVHFACVTDRQEAIVHALGLAQPRDCVLLTGKADDATLTIGETTRPWNEAALVRELLAGMGYTVSP